MNSYEFWAGVFVGFAGMAALCCLFLQWATAPVDDDE